MKFGELAKIFQKIEETSLRNEKTELLAELLKRVEDEELGPVIYLSLGRLRPLYDSLELNLAEKMAIRVVAWATGVKEREVGEKYREIGDLGDVVERLKVNRSPLTVNRLQLTVVEVYEELVRVAEDSGQGSQERKVRRLGKLLQSLDSLSAKYVVRLVVGRLRLGFSDMTVLDALSWMRVGDKSERKELERAFNVSADLAKIALVYKREGVNGLRKIRVTPGIPIRVARAERLGKMEEIIEKLKVENEKLEESENIEGVAVEPKFDGMRVEVHGFRKLKIKSQKSKREREVNLGLFGEGDGIEVKVFSRGMEDISHQFPEIVEEGRRWRKLIGEDFILDGEAIGYEEKTGKFLPFQETVKRKRKHGVGKTARQIPIKVLVFDVLLAGEEMLSKTYWQRRQKLESLFAQAGDSKVFKLADMKLVAKVEEMEEWFSEWVGEGLEGMMCKRLDGVYQAGARNFNWVKYKKAHEKQLADTLDCVVMGYYKGKGKRNKFGIGAFLVGVRKGEQWVTIAKIGTGLTDEEWRELYRRGQKVKCEKKAVEDFYVVAKSLEPDEWVRPEIVVEIEADEITRSPLHTSGYALRFPRLVRFRDDKEVDEATSLEEVEEIVRSSR